MSRSMLIKIKEPFTVNRVHYIHNNISAIIKYVCPEMYQLQDGSTNLGMEQNMHYKYELPKTGGLVELITESRFKLKNNEGGAEEKIGISATWRIEIYGKKELWGPESKLVKKIKKYIKDEGLELYNDFVTDMCGKKFVEGATFTSRVKGQLNKIKE